MRPTKLIAASAAAIAFSTVALADAPAPRRAVDLQQFDGRGYEIARTPNRNQPSCNRLQIDVTRSGDAYNVVNTCQRASGEPRIVRASASPLNDANNRLRFRAQGGAAGFIGVSQEFWVLDRADDYSWAILGTPGGNYFWLWSRSHSPANRAALLARVRALGYDTSNVVHVGA